MNETQNKLEMYRGKIDELNEEIINVLAERFKVTKKVGELKAENNMEPFDETREKKQIERVREIAQKAGVEIGLVEEMFKLITKEVVQQHINIKENKK